MGYQMAGFNILKKPAYAVSWQIFDKKYRYPLLSENVNSEVDAIMMFTQYNIKLKNNKFQIIRNIEALDENYTRVFARPKYGILF